MIFHRNSPDDLEGIKDEICDNVCRWRVRAFEQNKDPDDAERWLDMGYCSQGCPVERLKSSVI